jgi:putative transposase
MTEHPDGAWTAHQARNLAFSLPERERPVEFVVRDNDGKFTSGFDTVFDAEGVRVIRTQSRRRRPTRSQRDLSARSHAGAWTGS